MHARSMALLVTGGLLLTSAGGAVGYLAGTPRPPARAPGERETRSTASTAPAPRSPDLALRSLQAQLAGCEAARTEAGAAVQQAKDTLDKRQRIEALRERHAGLGSCFLFQRQLGPAADQELGPLSLTPEEEEAARTMSTSECASVVAWAMMAGGYRSSCLRALEHDDLPDPDGYRETCERHPIDERPLVKLCRARRDVMDALLAEAWARAGAPGIPRMTPDGGVRVYRE